MSVARSAIITATLADHILYRTPPQRRRSPQRAVASGARRHLQSGTVVNSSATGSVSGLKYVGGLIGNMASSATNVSKSYATGTVAANSNFAGGLIGNLSKGTIDQVYATGDVYNDPNQGSENTGGLVGANDYGTITNAYATGGTQGYYNVGVSSESIPARSQLPTRRAAPMAIWASADLSGKTIMGTIPARFRKPMRAGL